jgi:hypothetical protein
LAFAGVKPYCSNVGYSLVTHIFGKFRIIDGVMGEYGFIEAWEKKKKEIKPWLSDSNPKISKFAAKYSTYLDKKIQAEKRRIESNRALRGF